MVENDIYRQVFILSIKELGIFVHNFPLASIPWIFFIDSVIFSSRCKKICILQRIRMKDACISIKIILNVLSMAEIKYKLLKGQNKKNNF